MKWEMERSVLSRRNIFCLDRYGVNIPEIMKSLNRMLRLGGNKKTGKDTGKPAGKSVAVITM